MVKKYFLRSTKSNFNKKEKVYIFFFFFQFIVVIRLFSQNVDFPINTVHEYSLEQLALHDYNKQDTILELDWKFFYDSVKDGMQKLQSDIVKNPDKFPLNELECQSKKEPDAFRRWEYQMRRMPVKIVTPNSNLLDVNFKAKEIVTFCEDKSFEVTMEIKNISGFDLPIFYFTLTELPGVIINQKKIKLPEDISFIKSANTLSFNKGLKKDVSTIITLAYNVGCDGRGGSPVLKGKSKIVSNLNWEINLIGYLLDYKNKELYKVIDFGKRPKAVHFNKKTKY